MRRRDKALIAGLLAGAGALALPAWSQESRPESLLPPGFGDAPAPVPAPPPETAQPLPAPTPGADQQVQAVPESELPSLPLDEAAEPTPEELAAAEAAASADELPPAARRPIENVGPLPVERGGFAADGFGAANGRFLTGIMRRLDAPVASRWASMLLRRALLSPTDTPPGIKPADWVAERAALLLRMGEADAARMLVQSVDGDRYTTRLYQVALQTAEATSDPVALCAIADRGAAASDKPEWQLVRAICAGLAGDSQGAGTILDKARADNSARGVDLLLAEKLAAAGTSDRRAIGISWRSVDRLTAWRFGMGNAAFVPMPERLLASSGPVMQAWAARTAELPYSARIAPARTAAVLGVFSNAALVDLYSTLGDDFDPTAQDDSPTGRLRSAYAAVEPSDRITALRALWADPSSAEDRYANWILTARAAARIAPDDDHASDTGDLVAAMLSAGLDIQAARWAGLLPSGSGGEQAWAMLAVGAPRPLPVDPARIEGFSNRFQAQLLLASLVGLGRVDVTSAEPLAQKLGGALDRADPWTRAIDRAAALRQGATVALLAAAGLQSGGWGGVPPAYLRHIVAALAATGHEAEARMIAAEAIARTG